MNTPLSNPPCLQVSDLQGPQTFGTPYRLGTVIGTVPYGLSNTRIRTGNPGPYAFSHLAQAETESDPSRLAWFASLLR